MMTITVVLEITEIAERQVALPIRTENRIHVILSRRHTIMARLLFLVESLLS